tara:strand:+ start:493 stop:657 length:165 start_codon:yes stop_codon:yes gene_type:complete
MNVIQRQVQKWTTYKPKNYNSYWRVWSNRLVDHVGVLAFGAAVIALAIGFVVNV